MDMEKIKAYFNKFFVEVIKKQYTDFKGRASRGQYWRFVLCYVIVSIPLAVIDVLVFKAQILGLILALGLLLPSIAIGIRRLHDLGRCGWWYLIALIPVLGPIALLVMFCLPGENKANAYGNVVKA